MTKEEILTLAGAGFTAKQIAALNALELQQDPKPKQEPKPEPKPESRKSAEDPAIQKLIEEVTGVKTAIQNGNILNSNQKEPETADSILASIINPPTGKEEK